MGCCVCDDHDYCCRCASSDAERSRSIVEDVLDGTYDGEVDLPSFTHLDMQQASQATDAIVAVLKHEGII